MKKRLFLELCICDLEVFSLQSVKSLTCLSLFAVENYYNSSSLVLKHHFHRSVNWSCDRTSCLLMCKCDHETKKTKQTLFSEAKEGKGSYSYRFLINDLH